MPRAPPPVINVIPQERTFRKLRRIQSLPRGMSRKFGRTPRIGVTTRPVPLSIIMKRRRLRPLPRGRTKPFRPTPRVQPVWLPRGIKIHKGFAFAPKRKPKLLTIGGRRVIIVPIVRRLKVMRGKPFYPRRRTRRIVRVSVISGQVVIFMLVD